MLLIRSSGTPSHRQNAAGFTLVEISIVLVIFGLILGGVWVAAGHVRLNSQVRTASQQLLAIVQNVRATFAELGGVTGGNSSNINQALDQLKVFPLDMRQGTSPTGVIFNPWSQVMSSNAGGFGVGSVQVYSDDCTNDEALTTAQPCFAVTFLGVPQSACIDLLVQSSQEDPTMQMIVVNGTIAGIINSTCPPLPITPSAAAAACTNGDGNGTNGIVWLYPAKDIALNDRLPPPCPVQGR